MVQERVLLVDGPYTTNALKGCGVMFSVLYLFSHMERT